MFDVHGFAAWFVVAGALALMVFVVANVFVLAALRFSASKREQGDALAREAARSVRENQNQGA